MIVYIGIDDTDNKTSRGTGHLARKIAEHLSANYHLEGITRHQLLFDPRVPYTAKNSCAAIILKSQNEPNLYDLFRHVENLMMADFQQGSDPGLCVTSYVPDSIIDFGNKVKKDLVSQTEARGLAEKHKILLTGLGGTQDGVIGALAAVGLVHSGNDGRYVQIGQIREISGLQPFQTIINAGVKQIRTMENDPITEGLIQADKLRPARRESQPILYVNYDNGYWLPQKLD
ncbi:MAG: ABC transporter substrate-binding protein [Anaerolineaceae bacterium]|nr:ABC transporter substrate-binding protein [Anaerolineaceae bacterium]